MSKTIQERIDDKCIPEPNSGCYLWFGSYVGDGYGRIHYNGKLELAHRVVYLLYKGPFPQELDICHKCDMPACVNPDHLFCGTRRDNMQDKVRKGRSPYMGGEYNPNAKLTDAEKAEIKTSVGLQKDIAEKYGITQVRVSQIKRGL